MLLASASAMACAASAHARNIDPVGDNGLHSSSFRGLVSTFPALPLALPRSEHIALLDLYESGDQFSIRVTTTAGLPMIVGLMPLPALGLDGGSDLSIALENPVSGRARGRRSSGNYNVSDLSVAFPDEAVGPFASLFASSASPAGSTGGAPSPEVNAGLGMLLAGASLAFLRRKRGTRHQATAA